MIKNTKPSKALVKTDVMQSVILPNGLCIGNLFYRANKHTKERLTIELTSSCIMDILHNGENSSFIYKPIKATEEELFKLGFEKVYDGNFKRYQINLLETNIYLRPSLDKWYFGFVNKGQDCEINDCYELEFIHEIQNLIFSLTRVSLTVA